MWRFLFFLLLLVFSPIFASQSTEIIGVKVESSPNSTHFSFVLNKNTYGHVRYFPSSKKLMLDFANTKTSFNVANLDLSNTNISAVSVKQNLNKLSIIFTTKDDIKYNTHFFPLQKNTFAKLEIDIITLSSLKKMDQAAIPPLQLKQTFKQDILKTFTTLQSATTKQLVKHNLAKPRTQFYPYPTQSAARIYNVIIDAGHGGKDPGARGVNGAVEKNIVLAIAKLLAAKINASSNMRAILTRDKDIYVPLRQRLQLARKDKADLFVAIHADAFFNKGATGASVYALSAHGATTEAARWLAKRDNYSELGGVEFDALQDRSSLLRSVLIDLAQTATIRDSLRLGNKVLDALDDISSLHYKHVAQAPFVVLKSPDIPSILVEVGFITNLREERRLVNSWYQRQVAQALYQGINQYVQKYAKYGA